MTSIMKSFSEMWYEKDYISFFGFATLIILNTVSVVGFIATMLF